MSARSSEVDERDSIREQTFIIRFSTAKAEDSRFCSGVFVDPIISRSSSASVSLSEDEPAIDSASSAVMRRSLR